MVRTRVPTPHGEIFLHLYHNNRDNKEHLAIVVDPAQLLEDRTVTVTHAPFIRSRSLNAVWPRETPVDRITRGAYVGRLSSQSQNPSDPDTVVELPGAKEVGGAPSPLVRIHSECFTGETIGSMRCDCGEQLDEALRQIFQSRALRTGDGREVIVPGRGAVVYMRQEGRGIGLLAKLRAYNLQDLGHDTVSANLMLGHGADERRYEVAAAIMRDLGLSGGESDPQRDSGIRLLTNNPDKVASLEDAGVRVTERVPMVPRTWRCQDEDNYSFSKKYLRTKVLRMGHMLSLPPFGGVESMDSSYSD
ncbi:GTP cyclohydrolase II [Rickenella mellea]|uniref:GTP cyclohydrolase II n=1 Tax=Rickenella mellea TaxID=50990 RepID=A0A4R5XG56_9AGAM|nr:GTP cyclohydrolase II [Rickenella mellea]